MDNDRLELTPLCAEVVQTLGGSILLTRGAIKLSVGQLIILKKLTYLSGASPESTKVIQYPFQLLRVIVLNN